MLVAASAGGKSIALDVHDKHIALGTCWVGDAKDRIVDRIRVKLIQLHRTTGVGLVLQVAGRGIVSRDEGVELDEVGLVSGRA
jgi:hypothetical protein